MPHRAHAPLRPFLALLLGLAACSLAWAEPFTYQGELRHQGQPAHGLFDFRVTPFDLPEGGVAQAAPAQLDEVPVTGGRFTLALDFGSGILDGRELHLAIEVRSAGVGDFLPLLPRQPIMPTPYAHYAHNARPASGSVGAAEIDPGQVQQRIGSSCPVRHAIAGVAQDGMPSCVEVGQGWVEQAGHLSAAKRVGIGIATSQPAQLHVQRNSTIGAPQLLLAESDQDFARLSFQTLGTAPNNHTHFWTIAARTEPDGTGGPLTDRINFYNSRAGDLLSLLGNGNLGLGVVTPARRLDVNGDARIRGLSGSGTRGLQVNSAGDLVTGSTALLSVQAAEWGANPSNIAIHRLSHVTPIGSPGIGLSLVAPVQLPHGAVITGWRVWYRNRVAPSLDINLMAVPHASTGPTPLVARFVASVDSTTAVREHSASLPEHTVNLLANYYLLYATLTPSGNWQQDQHTIGTVLIEYRMP